jgi:hypothetical protein
MDTFNKSKNKMNRLFGVKKKEKEPEAPVNAPTLGEASERVSSLYLYRRLIESILLA